MTTRGCLLLAVMAGFLAACATTSPNSGSKPVPQQADRSSFAQLGKADLDRMADVEMRENTQSLRLLMIKLYKRNPQELKKSTAGTLEEMVDWVFEGGHGWKIKRINEAQGIAAIQLAFDSEYQGDRVLPLIVGLQTMLIKAHGGKTEFYITDSLDPQAIYNAARNVEIVIWKLSNARDSQGRPYLLTNEANGQERNLSFEREFGKIIGRLDMYALTISEKSERMVSRIMQNLATAIFLPI